MLNAPIFPANFVDIRRVSPDAEAPPDRSFQLKRWDEQGLCPFISPIDDVKKKEIYQPLNHDSEGDCPNMFTLLNVGRPYPVRRSLDSASYGLGPATPTFFG